MKAVPYGLTLRNNLVAAPNESVKSWNVPNTTADKTTRKGQVTLPPKNFKTELQGLKG